MRTKNVQLNIRTTAENKKRYAQAAKQCGLTLSDYILMRLDNRAPRELPPIEYTQILQALTTLCNRENTPQVQEELLNTLLAIQAAATLPEQEVR